MYMYVYMRCTWVRTTLHTYVTYLSIYLYIYIYIYVFVCIYIYVYMYIDR